MKNRIFPTVQFHGSAGSLGPGEKEQRFRPYREQNRLERGDEENS